MFLPLDQLVKASNQDTMHSEATCKRMEKESLEGLPKPEEAGHLASPSPDRVQHRLVGSDEQPANPEADIPDVPH